ncbi:hypothetical protein I7I53_09202 [Histoplasma capsulatum var. duboisii H88]|uniref:Uncharacterized protein n=1 Tax=Ajellomyces capsulatus (strain H88) TaxID=544711 RepID=A0A8A1LB21_AJEC8|nr:hypothetical protein I7I53_09202 [Histoplasma capsulatum var. duboisii H88]
MNAQKGPPPVRTTTNCSVYFIIMIFCWPFVFFFVFFFSSLFHGRFLLYNVFYILISISKLLSKAFSKKNHSKPPTEFISIKSHSRNQKEESVHMSSTKATEQHSTIPPHIQLKLGKCIAPSQAFQFKLSIALSNRETQLEWHAMQCTQDGSLVWCKEAVSGRLRSGRGACRVVVVDWCDENGERKCMWLNLTRGRSAMARLIVENRKTKRKKRRSIETDEHTP